MQTARSWRAQSEESKQWAAGGSILPMSIVPDAMFFLITMQLPTRAMVLVAFIDSGTKNLSEEVSVLEVPIRSPGMVVEIEASCAASAPDKPCKFSA